MGRDRPQCPQSWDREGGACHRPGHRVPKHGDKTWGQSHRVPMSPLSPPPCKEDARARTRACKRRRTRGGEQACKARAWPQGPRRGDGDSDGRARGAGGAARRHRRARELRGECHLGKGRWLRPLRGRTDLGTRTARDRHTWGHPDLGDTQTLGTPRLWGHVPLGTQTLGDTKTLGTHAPGDRDPWGHSVPGDTQLWGHKPLGTPKTWGHAPLGTPTLGDTQTLGTRPHGTPVSLPICAWSWAPQTVPGDLQLDPDKGRPPPRDTATTEGHGHH